MTRATKRLFCQFRFSFRTATETFSSETLKRTEYARAFVSCHENTSPTLTNNTFGLCTVHTTTLIYQLDMLIFGACANARRFSFNSHGEFHAQCAQAHTVQPLCIQLNNAGYTVVHGKEAKR